MGRTAAAVMVGLGVLAVAEAGWAQGQDDRQAPVLRVLLVNQAGAPSGVLAAAEKDASSIYAAAGVRLAWVDGPSDGRGFDVVVKMVAGANLVVGLSSVEREMTLGFAIYDAHAAGVHGRMVYARYDEIAKAADEHQMATNRLCGLVLAHEIGHLLLPSGHSQAGLMRANWELRTPMLKYFTKPQVATIQALLASLGR